MFETDLYGNDISSLENIDKVDTCQLLCANDPSCKYWGFTVKDKMCWKKTSAAGMQFRFDRLSGAKDCSPSHPAGSLHIYHTTSYHLNLFVFVFYISDCVQQHKDFNGHDIYNFKTNSIISCSLACKSEADCNFWTWFYSAKKCYLKTSDQNTQYNQDGFSGSKNCEPGNNFKSK